MLRTASIFVSLSLAIAGCSVPPKPSPSAGWAEQLHYRTETPRVIVQVCMPDRSANRRLFFGTVEAPRRAELFFGSIGGRGLDPIGTTEAGQPYYETYSELPGETAAIVVSQGIDGEQFVFKPLLRPSEKEWSQWIRPNFSTRDKNIRYEILAGLEFQDAPTVESAPRARYILMKFNDYLGTVRDRRLGIFTSVVPACGGKPNLSYIDSPTNARN